MFNTNVNTYKFKQRVRKSLQLLKKNRAQIQNSKISYKNQKIVNGIVYENTVFIKVIYYIQTLKLYKSNLKIYDFKI